MVYVKNTLIIISLLIALWVIGAIIYVATNHTHQCVTPNYQTNTWTTTKC